SRVGAYVEGTAMWAAERHTPGSKGVPHHRVDLEATIVKVEHAVERPRPHQRDRWHGDVAPHQAGTINHDAVKICCRGIMRFSETIDILVGRNAREKRDDVDVATGPPVVQRC